MRSTCLAIVLIESRIMSGGFRDGRPPPFGRVIQELFKRQDSHFIISRLLVLFYDVLTQLLFFCTHLQFICVLSFLPFLCSA